MNPAAPHVLHGRRQAARRRPSFIASAAIAVVLNAVALAVLAAATTRWPASAGGPQRLSWVTVVANSPRAPESAVEAPYERGVAPPVKEQRAAASPPASPEAAAPKAPAADDPAGSPTRFYRSGEVDRPAEPESDWNLDAAVLDSAGVTILVFDIFISGSGEVVGCTIVRPVDLPEDTHRLLENRLRQTVVKPALRTGVPVASVRRIEVSVLAPAS